MACSEVAIPGEFVRHVVELMRPQSSSSLKSSCSQRIRVPVFCGIVCGVEYLREREAMSVQTFLETIGVGMGIGKESKTVRRRV